VSAAGAARAGLALAAGLGALALAHGPGPQPCAAASAGRADPAHEIACGGGGGPLPDAARLVLGLPIDPNRAEPRTLEALPGVGPQRARAWASERERRPFCGVADLDRVSGIGPKTLRAVGPWLDFTGTPGCSAGSEAPMERGPRTR
jgi:hypothetical protein